jgi:hypothetical protein
MARQTKICPVFIAFAKVIHRPPHFGLVVSLENMVRDEMGHSEETERMLRDWPM